MRQPPTARYGPTDRYAAAPAAGMCLSVFALARSAGRALVGRPQEHARWADLMPSWRHYDKKDLDATMEGWLIPGTYMREGEDPTGTLARVMRDMLGVKRYTASERPRVHTATEPSGWYPGHDHWDIAFVYDVRCAKPRAPPPWWRELAWKAPRELKAAQFNWNDDLAKALGVAQR